MNERKITMLAIVYLNQVAEAIYSHLLQQPSGATAAIEAGHQCSSYAKAIAQSNIDGWSLDSRMAGIADAMEWLMVISRQYAPVLKMAPISVPSHVDLDTLAAAASAEAVSYLGCF